jgi:hypothetical protein
MSPKSRLTPCGTILVRLRTSFSLRENQMFKASLDWYLSSMNTSSVQPDRLEASTKRCTWRNASRGEGHLAPLANRQNSRE